MTSTTALTFKDTTFSVIDRNGYPWLKAGEISSALGYSRSDKVTQIYSGNSAEFTENMTAVITVGIPSKSADPDNLDSGVSEENSNLQTTIRIFSLRGAHLIAMFARTPAAKEFRAWVLDILDNHVGAQKTETLEASEQQTLMEIVKAKVAHLPTAEQGKPIAEIWSRVHHKFRVAKYSQLPRTQLTDVILYVTGMELKSAKAKPADPLCTQEQRSELAKLTARIGSLAHMNKSLEWAVSNRLRTELGVSSTTELKASQYQAAVSFLGNMDSLVSSFRSRVIGIEKQFCRMIVRDGSPDAVAEFEATFSGEMKHLFADTETRPLLT